MSYPRGQNRFQGHIQLWLLHCNVTNYNNFLCIQVFSVQTVGGAGAVRIGADILIQLMKCTTAYHSDPSWGNYNLEDNLVYSYVIQCWNW